MISSLVASSEACGFPPLERAMAQHGVQAIEVFSRAVEICQQLGEETSDRLKRQAILAEMLSKV
jgi:hypothetical protein